MFWKFVVSKVCVKEGTSFKRVVGKSERGKAAVDDD